MFKTQHLGKIKFTVCKNVMPTGYIIMKKITI